jgi:hypothetical protein
MSFQMYKDISMKEEEGNSVEGWAIFVSNIHPDTLLYRDQYP